MAYDDEPRAPEQAPAPPPYYGRLPPEYPGQTALPPTTQGPPAVLPDDWQTFSGQVHPSPEPEKRDWLSEGAVGAARGAVNSLYVPVMRGIDYAARGIAEASGSQAAQDFIAPKQANINAQAERANAYLAPSVPQVTDIHSAGDFGRFAASSIGEFVPLVAGMFAANAVGGPPAAMTFAMAQGALQGGTEAAAEHNGDLGATGAGVALGMAQAGVPIHILYSTAGMGVIRRVAMGILGMGTVGGAATVAHPLVGAAAGEGYEAPSWGQVGTGVASGAIVGAGLGAAGGPSGVKPGAKPEQSTPVSTGVAQDHAAALNDQLNLPQQGPYRPPEARPIPGLGTVPTPEQQALPVVTDAGASRGPAPVSGWFTAPPEGFAPADRPAAQGMYGPTPPEYGPAPLRPDVYGPVTPDYQPPTGRPETPRGDELPGRHPTIPGLEPPTVGFEASPPLVGFEPQPPTTGFYGAPGAEQRALPGMNVMPREFGPGQGAQGYYGTDAERGVPVPAENGVGREQMIRELSERQPRIREILERAPTGDLVDLYGRTFPERVPTAEPAQPGYAGRSPAQGELPGLDVAPAARPVPEYGSVREPTQPNLPGFDVTPVETGPRSPEQGAQGMYGPRLDANGPTRAEAPRGGEGGGEQPTLPRPSAGMARRELIAALREDGRLPPRASNTHAMKMSELRDLYDKRPGPEPAPPVTTGGVDESRADTQPRAVGGADPAAGDGIVGGADRAQPGDAAGTAGARAAEPALDTPLAALVDTSVQARLDQGTKPADAVRDKAALAAAKREMQKRQMAGVDPTKVGLVRKGAPEATRKPETEIRPDLEEEVATELGERGLSRKGTEIGLAEETPMKVERDAAEPVAVHKDEGAPPPRSTQTSNLDRYLKDLENEVATGEKTATEASAEWGLRVGRAEPEHRTYEAWLEHRIEHLNDKDNFDAVLQKGRELEANRRNMSEAEYKKAGEELNKELGHYDPEYVQGLEKQLVEVKNGPKPERKSSTPKETPDATEARHAEEAKAQTALEKAMADELARQAKSATEKPAVEAKPKRGAKKAPPEVHEREGGTGGDRFDKPVRDVLNRASPEGDSVHTYLDAIIKDPAVRARSPYAYRLAKLLREVLPADLKVFTLGHAAKHFQSIGYTVHNDPSGFYNHTDRVVVLNEHPRTQLTTTLLHEAVHAAEVHLVDHLERTGGGNTKEIQALRLINNEVNALLERNPGKHTADLHHFTSYAATDWHEFIASYASEPELQKFASRVKPSPEFVSAMRELGYEASPNKSLWQHFVEWTRKLLGMPEKSENFLDHIMRPMEDIIRQGAEYNRALGGRGVRAWLDIDMTKDPALRGIAGDTADLMATHFRPNFDREGMREMADAARRHVDWGRRTDILKKAFSQGVFINDLHRWNKELFDPVQVRDEKTGKPVEVDGKPKMSHEGNPFTDWTKAASAQTRRTQTLGNEWGDRLGPITEKLRGPQHDAVANLLNEATLAEVHLGPGADNSKFSEAKQKIAAELQARYDALPKDAQEAYVGARDLEKDMRTAERDAELSNSIQMALPDITKAQADSIKEQVRTKAGIKQLIDNPDKTPVAAAFAKGWDDNTRGMVRDIARVHGYGFTEGDYFHLGRYGDYVVSRGDKGTPGYEVRFFENRSDADAWRKEALAQSKADENVPYPSDVQLKRNFKARSAIPDSVLASMDRILEKRDFTDAQRKEVEQAWMASLLAHGARNEANSSRMRREGVKGASLEVERTLSRRVMQTAAHVGFLEHNPAQQTALRKMHEVADYRGKYESDGSNIPARMIVNELEKRAQTGDDLRPGSVAGVMGKTNQFGWMYSLLSPSQVAVNTIEAHAAAASHIGGRHGFVPASAQLARAVGQLAPKALAHAGANTKTMMTNWGKGLKSTDWDFARNALDLFIKAQPEKAAEYTALHDQAAATGILHHTDVQEAQRIANGGGVTGGWWGWFQALEGQFSNSVETANKMAVLKTAYDMELRKTGDQAKARDYAVETLQRVFVNNSPSNAPRLLTRAGALGSYALPIMQFKRYGMHAIADLASLVKEGLDKTKDQSQRNEALKALAFLVGTRAAMAGTLTWMADPLRFLGGIWDWMTGASRPHDYQSDVRKYLAQALGPAAGEVVGRGIPRALGMSVEQRLGAANLLGFPDLQSYDSKGYLLAFAQALGGVSGQDATHMAEGLGKILHGDMGRGLTDFIPVRMARDMVKAGMLAKEGVTDSRGKPVLGKDKITPLDVAYQAAGFRPARVAEAQEGRGAVLQKVRETGEAKTKVLSAYSAATDQAGKARAMQDVAAYNKAHPATPIKRGDLVASVNRRKQATKDPATFGIAVPKAGARDFKNAGSFANTN